MGGIGNDFDEVILMFLPPAQLFRSEIEVCDIGILFDRFADDFPDALCQFFVAYLYFFSVVLFGAKKRFIRFNTVLFGIEGIDTLGGGWL